MFQFSFDFRTTLPLEIVLLTHIPTCIHRNTRQNRSCFCLDVNRGIFIQHCCCSSHTHTLICPHNYSQSTIFITIPHYHKLYENESNTHIQTHVQKYTHTHALTHKYKYSQRTHSHRFISFISLLLYEYIHSPTHPYLNKPLSCGRL